MPTITSRVCGAGGLWTWTGLWPSPTPKRSACGSSRAPGLPSRITASSSSAAVRSAGPPGPACIGRAAHPESDGHRPPPPGTDPKEKRPWQARASRAARATRTSRKPSRANPRRTAATSISPPDVAGLFKDTADAETGHAFGHLDFLKDVGDPATGEPIGKTETSLKSAIAGETYEYT